MSRYDLKFGNTWLSEFGAVCTEEPPIEIAQRDFTLVDIPGKDGSDCIDNGRYLNVEMTRTIAMVGRKVSTAQEKAIQLVNNFAYLQGYQTFEDTHHNGLVTEAVLTNFEDVIRTLRTMRTATLKFSRKPYWYLKEAHEEQEVSLESTFTLVNPYPSTACPTFVFKVNTSEHSGDSTTHISITISGRYTMIADFYSQFVFFADEGRIFYRKHVKQFSSDYWTAWNEIRYYNKDEADTLLAGKADIEYGFVGENYAWYTDPSQGLSLTGSYSLIGNYCHLSGQAPLMQGWERIYYSLPVACIDSGATIALNGNNNFSVATGQINNTSVLEIKQMGSSSMPSGTVRFTLIYRYK